MRDEEVYKDEAVGLGDGCMSRLCLFNPERCVQYTSLPKVRLYCTYTPYIYRTVSVQCPPLPCHCTKGHKKYGAMLFSSLTDVSPNEKSRVFRPLDNAYLG
jgi:hypothetical protein